MTRRTPDLSQAQFEAKLHAAGFDRNGCFGGYLRVPGTATHVYGPNGGARRRDQLAWLLAQVEPCQRQHARRLRDAAEKRRLRLVEQAGPALLLALRNLLDGQRGSNLDAIAVIRGVDEAVAAVELPPVPED